MSAKRTAHVVADGRRASAADIAKRREAVAELAAAGRTQTAIAAELGISPDVVHRDLSAIRRGTGQATKAPEIAVIAVPIEGAVFTHLAALARSGLRGLAAVEWALEHAARTCQAARHAGYPEGVVPVVTRITFEAYEEQR